MNPVIQGTPQVPYLNQKNNPRKREELEQRLDQAFLRLATVNKIPLKKGWNYPNFKEWLSKKRLLSKNGEWSIRGGQKIGNKYLSFLDVDIFKEDIPLTLQSRLEKNILLCLGYLGCFQVKTKKGFHVYLLTDYLLPNCLLYHVDKFGKKRIIGSIQSKGKYVVGFDSLNKWLIENGKWFWHGKDLNQVKETLSKFHFLLENQAKPQETLKTVQYPAWDYNLNKPVIRDYELTIEELLKTPLPQPPYLAQKHTIQAKILSKLKIPLPDLWKVFYQDWKTKQTGYFLVNSYQKSYVLPNLGIGSVRNMVLIQGIKHDFLRRILA